MSSDRDISHIQLKITDEDANRNEVAPQTKKKCLNLRNKICIGILIIIGATLLGYMLMRHREKLVYVVIIDAGSTGSRVHAFSFHKSIPNGSLILNDESYANIEPGLSSFADDPVKGAEFLQTLIETAKAFVPQTEWAITPLSLKATAGLRLLPKEKASGLIKECQKLVENSGFLTSKKSASIMSGIDEGIFSWFTTNFLLGRLTAQSSDDTVATFDFGGGSVQVTFAPDTKHIKDQEKDIFAINAFEKNVSIYSHSYLGMGLKAARRAILTYGNNARTEDNNGSPLSMIELRSECINPIISTEWSYGGVDYLVKGSRNGTDGVVRFSECLQIVKNYVGTIVEKPLGLENKKIVAFSYFLFRAAQVGLVDPLDGGIITVDAYLKQAMVHCEKPKTDQPFMCLDLTYIYVLLLDGFNLQPTTEIELRLAINNHRLTWAFGAAFNILQNGL